jgi:hypothetical protein
MADRKIVSGTADFTIPKHTTDSETRDVIVKLSKADKYDVYQKDFPANLPKTGYAWINNFGLKERKQDTKNPNILIETADTDPYADVVEAYTIEMDDIAGKEPVYFDGKAVQKFPSKKISVGNNRIHVTLTLGDPPLGWPKP